jgi:primosomal protein N' (replication factor Y)
MPGLWLCEITVTYHKKANQLLCHYCGTYYDIPDTCSRCGSKKIEYKGTGTEKIEEEINRLFPNVKVKRMDSDSVTKKDSHRKILKSFHDGEYDILVGTQMISKGLDFPRVQLVGVINADIGLFNPDFRSSERTYQLLSQVSGRPGRNTDFGKVVIQTIHPTHPVFKFVKDHNYDSFYDKEIQSRKEFEYPPFCRMVLIEVNGLNVKEVYTIASKIYLFLSKNNKTEDINILKPAPSIIYKLKNKYRYNVIIKTRKFTPGLPDKEDMKLYSEHQALLFKLKNHLNQQKLKTDQRVLIDVDPVDFY